MNRLLMIPAVLCLASFGIHAQTLSGAATTAQADTQAASATRDQDDVGDGGRRRDCVSDTGSRITASANARARRAGKPGTDCVAAPGSSYSRSDLRSTGETDIADSLRKLDPSIH